jgi:hypothetical protein
MFYVPLTVHIDNLCNETNLMHYLSLIYLIKNPLHISGMFTAHHQEVFTVCAQQLVRFIGLS